MKRLENKTAIVTGGNSGIGKATAILFAKEGADLVLCARRKEALDEVAEECRKYGVQVVTVKADVSSHEDCSAVVKAAVDTFGKVDILVWISTARLQSVQMSGGMRLSPLTRVLCST